MNSHCVAGDALTAQDVYDIWKIRDAVFAFEQHVDDVDVDGLDLLPTTTHLWLSDVHGPVSYLRVYLDEATPHIGRVCTRADRRGRGLSARLITEANRLWGDHEIVLNAQAHLERWYQRFGYLRTGPNFDDAGIAHVPMRRPASPM